MLAASTLVGGFKNGQFENGFIIKRDSNIVSQGHQRSRSGRSFAEHGGGGLDPHGQFCVDISKYGPISYRDQEKECCQTTTRKECRPVKSDPVCKPVTEMRCDIHLYTECQLTMTNETFPSEEPVVTTFTPRTCTDGEDIVYHKKFEPNCTIEESKNCVQVWKTLANGEKVKEVTDDCKVVKWKNCKLVPRDVAFTVPKVNCTDGEKVVYKTCKRVEKDIMTSQLTCEVKFEPSCKPEVVTKCATIEYMECKDIPVLDCGEPIVVREPFQNLEHKEWCLFPKKDDSAESRALHEHDHEHHHDHDHSDVEDQVIETGRSGDIDAVKVDDSNINEAREARLLADSTAQFHLEG